MGYKDNVSTGPRTSLIVAELVGQYKIWDGIISQEAQNVGEVIQMGNLISIVKNSDEYEATEDRNLKTIERIDLFRSTTDNWLQLIGPNEIFALNRPGEVTRESTDRYLRRAWLTDDPAMYAAGVSRGRLLTHGGLTHGLWVKLGRPQTAIEAAEAINSYYAKTLYQGKSMNLGHVSNFSANPIWANPLTETYPSWITAEEQCPFAQLHGGANLASELGSSMLESGSYYLDSLEKVRFGRFGSSATIGGTEFSGVFLDLPATPAIKLHDNWALCIESSRSQR